MKTKLPLLLLAAACAAVAILSADDAKSARIEIGDTVELKVEVAEVRTISRVWRVQADANGEVTVFFETVTILADGHELQTSTRAVRRPVAEAAAALELLEKLGRTWLAEDEALAAQALVDIEGR